MGDSEMRMVADVAVKLLAVLDGAIDQLHDSIKSKHGLDEQQIHIAASQAAIQLASVRAMYAVNAQSDFATKLAGELEDVMNRAFSQFQSHRHN